MFETVDSAEIRYLEPIGIPGVRVWTFTGHGLNLPWFHVSLQRQDVAYGRVIFASSLAQVLQLKEQCGSESLDVLLVSPPYVNGTQHWRMELLREAWTARESGNTVYIVQGRRHYSDDPDQEAFGLELTNGYERVF